MSSFIKRERNRENERESESERDEGRKEERELYIQDEEIEYTNKLFGINLQGKLLYSTF